MKGSFGPALQSHLLLRTLKSRIAAGVLLAMTCALALVALKMDSAIERSVIAQAHQRESLEARRAAALIEGRVQQLQQSLALVAAQLDRATLDDPAALAQFFEQRPVLRAAFANVYAASADGRVRLLVDDGGSRHPGNSIADREYFQRLRAERQPVVSEPVLGRFSSEPAIVFSHPMVEGGEVWGVIGGGLRLASGDMLAELAEHRSGENDDTLVVVTDRHGRILAHPQRARLLQGLGAEPRLAPAFARWLAAGAPRSSEPGQWKQQAEVVEMSEVAGTAWVVWRATRTAPLIASVRDATAEAAWQAAGLVLLVSLLTAAFLAWQLRPLVLLERRAARLLTGAAIDEDWPQASGEIGRLEQALRRVASERAASESSRAEVLQRLSSLMLASPVGLAFTRNQRFELVSAECCRMLGRREDELLNQPAQLIFASNEDYAALGPRVGAAFGGDGAYIGEWQLLHASGHVFWARLHARPVAVGNPGAGTIWCLYDIGQEVQARATLEHAAEHDPLTGALNRKGFDRVLAAAFATPEVPATLVMLDLDRFKPINDAAGHAAGDAMLKAVTQALLSQVRTTDRVARLGGDEFALLLPGCSAERGLTIAELARAAIANLTLGWQGRTLSVGASLGVAARGAEHATAQQWLAEADAACYEAKSAGRNRVQLAHAGPPARGPRAAALRVV